ncbi:MAG: beta-galactosidase trimerization domain-containing protein, partial [Chloroflexota bacterium]|nr:beta-galactosidase trimerization domain-containing protein [Chloroflexota bacterium]
MTGAGAPQNVSAPGGSTGRISGSGGSGGRSADDQPADRRWWAAGVRMHHPNMRDLDVGGMDFERFVVESVSLHANSVVISAAGIVAFYPSAIFGHHVSELLQGRDFVGGVTERAHAAGLRVVARVDFAGAREPILRAHPDWVARDAAGETVRRRGVAGLYATCPNSPYRGDGFAIPVVRELLTRYPLDGFHVNGGGWPGHCFCTFCERDFRAAAGESLPRSRAADHGLWGRYVEWRHQRVAETFRRCAAAAQALNPDVFWMGELGLRWEGSFDMPAMAGACSPLLVTTGNVVAAGRAVRSQAGLAARYTRTVDPDLQPLVNLKVFVQSGGWPRSMVPPAEYRLWTWQALANGAGLKLPVFGTLEQDDRRNLPAISAAFAMIERFPEVYRDARPVAEVALVWPGRTFDHWTGLDARQGGAGAGSAASAAASFDGMYTALLQEHVPFDVLADVHLTPERLTRYRVVVLANAACLEDAAAAVLAGFVQAGGGLLLTAWTGWCDQWGQPRTAPALAGLAAVTPLDAPPAAAPGLYLAPPAGVPRPDTAPVLAGLEDVGLITVDGPAPAIAAGAAGQAVLRLVRHRSVL